MKKSKVFWPKSILFLLLFLSVHLLFAANAFAIVPDEFIVKSNSSLPLDALFGVAYGKGVYVAVGYNGAIIKSSDAETWENVKTKSDIKFYTGISNPDSFCFWGLAFGNGVFVAGGSEGVILTSSDGKDWAQQDSGVTTNIFDVEYLTFNGESAFYALTKGKFLKSTDGITWTPVVPTGANPSYTMNEITVGNGGTRLAVGESEGKIFSTTDGTTWTASQPSSPAYPNGINMLRWMNDRYFISGGTCYIWTSTDLSTFTLVGAPFKQTASQNGNQMFNGFYDGSKYYLFGDQSPYGPGAVYTWTGDGIWDMQTFSNSFVTYKSAFINGKYFRVGNEGMLVSSDGQNWSYKWGGCFYDIIYDGTKYIAAGRSGGRQGSDGAAIWSSGDLQSWTQASVNEYLKPLRAIAYGSGKYVAIGELNDTTTALATSNDGVSWTKQTGITGINDTSDLFDIAYGNGKFVAVGSRSNTPVIKTSEDGVTWSEPTPFETTSTYLRSVTYVNNQFVALGFDHQNFTDNCIWTSPDGVNWTDRSDSYPAAADGLLNIIYDGSKYILLGFTYDLSIGDRLFSRTSSDLSTWSEPAVITGSQYMWNNTQQIGRNGSNIYALAYDPTWTYTVIFYSSDQGQTWQETGIDTSSILPYAVSEANNKLLILGEARLVMAASATPAVTAVNPSSGPVEGGTSVTITGTNFTGASSVTIGGVAATDVTVVNSTTITAITPAGTAGAKDVVVTTARGSGTGTGLYTYVPAPTVTGISPAGGPTAGGTSVTITGTDFTGATGVTIGGNAATGITVVNASTITATTPVGTLGTKDVVVTTPSGSGTGTGLYSYVEAPAAVTNAADGISSTGATLNGTVNAKGASTAVTFEYGPTTGYGSTVTADQSPVTGNGNTSVSKTISGLTPNTTYHYRVVGANSGGTTNGGDQTFTTDITSAGVTGMTAPAAGSVPTLYTALTPGNASSYTVTGLTWQNGDGTAATLTSGGKFKAGSTYQAVIELTSAAGNKFQAAGIANPSVNTGTAGAGTVSGGDVSGNKLTYTVTFPATAAQSVSAIAVKTQPAKLTYIEGDTLSLSGLEATLTYNDGTAADVAYANFGANGITASPDGGTTLTVAAHDGQPVTLTCNSKTAGTNDLTVSAPSSDAGLTSVLGQTIMAGTEAGTSGAPKTASINVTNGVAAVAAGDIAKHDPGAAVTFYGTDSTFTAPAVGSVSLTAGTGTDVYIMVAAADSTTLYYKVTINRAAAPHPSGDEGSSSSLTPPPVTVTGSVIDSSTGNQVSDIKATITTDSNGNSTISMDAAQTVVLKEPDGNTSQLADITKVAITTDTGTPIPISSDGTIKVENLAKGTDNSFEITYDLGNGQKIIIGTMEIKIDQSGNADITTALIDPYGIITDSATGKAVGGVNLTLYYADTERNRASGKTPGTVVPLPVIDGFKPNDNKNPQVSDASGAYGFMVFPNSDYYVVAEKDGYNKYISPMLSVEKELVKWDFKMQQEGAERLFGQDRVDTAIEIAKTMYANNISNVVLATAENYPDALAGSVLAYKLNAPILLVGSSNADHQKVLTYLKEYMNPAGMVYILGGAGAVSQDVEAKVNEAGFRNIDRIGGADRYETSVKVAEELGVNSGTPIVLVSGENYPDALSASSPAAIKQYPILLSGKDGISDSVKNEILKINPGRIYIIGLQGAIDTAVEAEAAKITSIDKVNIVRIGGLDRYETSLEAAKCFSLAGDTICAATGNDFPDALAGSIYAAKNNAPIILVDKMLSDNQMTYLKNMKLSKAAIFGGEGAVSEDIMEQLSQLLGIN